MSSIQERLQLKRVPLDTWTTREKLCLASAVVRSGDQNWMSVSRALKTIAEPNRPQDWYSQKSCAAQYGSLLENVETPKRKKRNSEGGVETPQESILKRLTEQRIQEIENNLVEMNTQYEQLMKEIVEVRDPSTTEERLQEMWTELEAAKRAKERENARRAAWLKEREEKRVNAEKSWRPQTTVPAVQATQSTPSSPLLSSLLKSTPVVTTPQHILHPNSTIDTVSPSATAPTLSLLLEQSQDSKHAAIEHIKSQLVQIEHHYKASTSGSPVPVTSAVVSAPALDIDDIEIKAEDVYAFRDIDIHIPPVAAMHKGPPRVEKQFKKEEEQVIEVPADTVPEEVKMETEPEAEPSVVESAEAVPENEVEVIECVQEEAPEEVPVPTPQPEHQLQDQPQPQPTEVKIAFPEVKFPIPEIKVIQAEDVQVKEEILPKPEEEIQEEPVEEPQEKEEEIIEQETHIEPTKEEIVEPPEPEPEVSIPEPEPAPEEAPSPQPTEVEIPTEDIPLPPPEETTEEVREPTPQPEAQTQPEPEAIAEVQEIPLPEEPEVKTEEVPEDKRLEDAEDSIPLKEMIKEETTQEKEKIEEDTHTETDDDTPMELSREEDKEGKTKRDYSRKKKPDSRTCSGSESAPESPSSNEAERQHRLWKKSVMLVYSRLCAHKYASLFLRPITDEEAPGYSDIVHRPMDLSTIRRNIDAGHIRTTAAFQRDVLLMLSNALMYNSSSHSVYAMAKDMFEEAQCQLGMLLAAQAHAGLVTTSVPPTRKRRPQSTNPNSPSQFKTQRI